MDTTTKQKTKKKVGKIIGKTFLSILIILVIITVVAAILNTILANKNISYIKNEIDTVQVDNQLVPTIDEETGFYTYYTDDNLKVLDLSDVHIGGGWMSYKKDRMAINAVSTMVAVEKPDLITITGDNVYPVFFQSGTFNNKTGAKIFATLMDKLGIYWAPVFGNHDTESYAFFSRNSIGNYYEEGRYAQKDAKRYCLFSKGPSDIDGVGNYVVNVKNSKGVITQSLFMMDTGSYVDNDYFGALWKYDGLHQNQIDWYKTTLQKFALDNQKADKTKSIPKSLLFIHIPLEEYATAWDEYKAAGDKDTENVKYFYGTADEKDDKVYHSLYEDKMFETMEELGSTQGVFCGHDHLNNFSVAYKGIRLNYGYTIDYLAYANIYKYGAQRGCTIIDIAPDGTYSSHLENYYQDKYNTDKREKVTMDKYYPTTETTTTK